MVGNRRKVTLQVGTNFFEKIFEPSRRDVEKQLGTKVTQAAFSEMLFRKNLSLKIKLNKNLILGGKKKRGKKKI